MRMNNLTPSAVATNALALLLMILIIPGCNKDLAVTQTDKTPLVFSGLKFEGNVTRLTGNEWDSGDEIGVFAYKSGEDFNSSSIIDNYANYTYSTSGSGTFYPKGNEMYYPEDKTAMDIVAYYPYSAEAVNYTVPVNVKEQKELLYSNNLKGLTEPASGQSTKHTFNFSRLMSNLSLNITSTTAGASIEDLTVTVKGAATKGSFSLTDASLTVDASSVAAFDVATTGTQSERLLSAFLLPTDNAGQVELTFSVGDAKLYTWKVPHKLESGKKYSYIIKLDHSGTEVITKEGYMEVPVYATADEAPNSIQVVHMVGNKSWLNNSFTYGSDPIRNYTALYDKENRVPYWVAFPLHPSYLGSAKRTDDWSYDPLIPENVQPNIYKAWKPGGLDRGHLMASADRNASANLNRTTFYFSNMGAQNSKFNQGPWNVLEEKVRVWAKETSKYDTLYVVTGVVLPKPPKQFEYANDNDGKKSVIPEYFYKALLKKNKQTNEYSSIGFYMENDATGASYSQRVVSVAKIEEETGFTFFPGLPSSVAAEVKQNASLSPHWN